jgi:membrane-associated protein
MFAKRSISFLQNGLYCKLNTMIMQAIIDFFSHLTNAEWIMAHGGLYIVLLIVFAETGLFLGFFLPGDYLLFISGMLIAQAPEPFATPVLSLGYWCALISLAAILGNYVGYWFGVKSGPYLFERKETWLFKRKHLLQARDFYEKRGGGAIVVARFLPIVRTFAPIVAGVVKMNFRKFTVYNISGALLWVVSLTTLGFGWETIPG